MGSCSVYVLLDENGNPFYVGVTNNVEARYKSHISQARQYIKVGEQNWVNSKIRKIAELILNGIKPGIKVIEECRLSIGDERELFHYNDLNKYYSLLQIPPTKYGRYTYAYKFKPR